MDVLLAIGLLTVAVISADVEHSFCPRGHCKEPSSLILSRSHCQVDVGILVGNDVGIPIGENPAIADLSEPQFRVNFL